MEEISYASCDHRTSRSTEIVFVTLPEIVNDGDVQPNQAVWVGRCGLHRAPMDVIGLDDLAWLLLAGLSLRCGCFLAGESLNVG